MEKSASITNLAKALITFHVKVGKIRKDAANPYFNNRYASLSNILEAINEPLAESGLSISQFPSGQNGLTTILMHGETGEFIQDTYDMAPVKGEPQARGSAITYQRRYAIAAILSLTIDEDDDANAASAPAKGAQPKAAEAKLEKPWLNKDTKEFNAVLNRLAGGATMAQVKEHFKVSKEVEGLLNKHLQPVNA